MENKKVNYNDEYEARQEANRKLQAYANELGFDGYRPVEIQVSSSTRSNIKADVNWSAFGAVTPEKAIAFSKLLVKAAELAENYKYNGYEVVYR